MSYTAKGEVHKRIFLIWARERREIRSETLARVLGAQMYTLCHPRLQSRPLLPVKYAITSLQSLWILFRERPHTVFVMNPPVFTGMVVWIFSLLARTNFVMDTHSAAFTRPAWRRLLIVHRFLARRAALNILHNSPLEETVQHWGARTISLFFVPFNVQSDAPFPYPSTEGTFRVAVVSSYYPDEPLKEVMQAAVSLPDVTFFVTGSTQLAPPGLISGAPPNVVFTDYLRRDAYLALLAGADVIVSLTTESDTMQCGAAEALLLGRPILTSDWVVLREFFYKGAAYADNSADGIRRALETIRTHRARFER
jgi:glycosyltransferase involved in cell wall biosynthesis